MSDGIKVGDRVAVLRGRRKGWRATVKHLANGQVCVEDWITPEGKPTCSMYYAWLAPSSVKVVAEPPME